MRSRKLFRVLVPLSVLAAGVLTAPAASAVVQGNLENATSIAAAPDGTRLYAGAGGYAGYAVLGVEPATLVASRGVH